MAIANWNDATISEFHSKAGKGVGAFGDRLMLLTTVGARKGLENQFLMVEGMTKEELAQLRHLCLMVVENAKELGK